MTLTDNLSGPRTATSLSMLVADANLEGALACLKRYAERAAASSAESPLVAPWDNLDDDLDALDHALALLKTRIAECRDAANSDARDAI